MKKHSLLVVVMLLMTITIGLFLTPTPAMAIIKVTPTPVPSTNEEPTQDIPTLLERAIAKIESEDFSGAINDLNAILEIDNALWDAYFFRGYANAQIGDFDRAIDDYTRAIAIHPYDWTAYNLRGDLYFQIGDLEQANLDYDQTLYLNPRYFQAYAGKALLNLQRGDQSISLIYQGLFEALRAGANGDTNEAYDILTDTIDNLDVVPVPEELGYVYYNRANLSIGFENWNDALNDMNEAIALQPEMQDYYMGRGFVYSETNQHSLAAPDFYQRMTLVELTSIDDTLDFGTTVSVDMDYGVVARLTFDGESGQTITLTARDSLGEGVDPLLVLLAPDGTPLAGNDDGGGDFDSMLSDYVLPTNGTYTAVISHANAGFVGTVTVSLK